ncbi:MAG: GAF domain-containing protein [Fimbriimonadia bacterium]
MEIRASLRIVLYSAAVAWAVANGLDWLSAARVSALMAAAFGASLVFARRAGDLGFLVGAWLEAVSVAFLLWLAPSRPELLWVVLVPMSVANHVSCRAASVMALACGGCLVASGIQAGVLSATHAPALAAAVAGLVSVPLLFRNHEVRVPEEPIERQPDPGLLAELEATRESEREARRAYREVVGLHKQLRAVHDQMACSYRLMIAATDRDSPGERVLDEAIAIAGAGAGTLWLVEGDGARLAVRSCSGPHALRTDRISVDSAEDLARTVREKGAAFASSLFSGPTAGTEEIVIRDGDRLLGLLTLRPHRKPLDPTAIAQLSQCLPEAVRIVLSRERDKNKLAFAEARVQATDLIACSDPPSGVAARAIELMRRFLDAEHWSVWMLRGSKLEMLAERGRSLDLPSLMDFGAGGVIGWIASDHILFSGDATADGTLRGEQAIRARVRSVLAIPLESGGKAVGAVFAAHSLPDRFPATERAPVLLLATPLARAVELSEIRSRPLALVRLDPSTGMLAYGELMDRLSEDLAQSHRPALIRFALGAVVDAERREALGRAIAEALGRRGFAAPVGEREFVVCLPNASRPQAEAIARLIVGRFADMRIETRVAIAGEDGLTRHGLIEALG